MGWIFWLFSMLSCSLHYNAKGLIFQPNVPEDGDNIQLYLGTSEGKEFRIYMGDDTLYFTNLLGCGSEVSGFRLGRSIWVDSWTITDAGDGSAPFLGILRLENGRYILHDINSDTDIELLDQGWDPEVFWELVNKPILVTGFVVGGHQIQVLSIRLLE